jgi:acetyl-CoA synthetase
LLEDRKFPPDESFVKQANVSDPGIYERALADPQAFWAERAQGIDWIEPYTQVLDWNVPWAKWFVGGKLNASANCVDRHTRTWRKNKAAIIFEGEPGDSRTLTYNDLYREVNQLAAALQRLGIKKGDRVAIYLGMVPELPIAMLACARLGAPHTVVFGGFSPESLRDRIQDCEAKILITADGGWRRGGKVPLKDNADKAVVECPTIEHVVVVNRVEDARKVPMTSGRDIWWHRLMEESKYAIVEPEPVDSEHPLYILYTSGTTGKPKGMLHTTAGYLVGTMTTSQYVFDLKDEDIYFCTADIGWVTGHSYIVYGPLAAGATCVMYEGSPDYPDKDRFWDIVEKYRATILYTAPTAIRSFMRWGTEFPEKHDLSSLRLLGSVGEPINPEAWMWYREHIGGNKTPIVDTWWQTETGNILITPLPGLTTTKPGSATIPFPGIDADVGDEDGYIWLLGRVDDVLNVAGHRIGTMEVESALVSHPSVAEAAVVGITHEIKGQAIAAFVTLRAGNTPSDEQVDVLKRHVGEKIGPIARPDKVFFTAELPKTRSAKIMRRLLRDIGEGRVVGDTTTLADPTVLAEIRSQYEEKEG